MTPEELVLAVRGAFLGSIGSDVLALNPEAVPETVKIERPRNRDHGDWATSVVVQLAKCAGLAPRALAEILAEILRLVEGIDSIEVAGPGFTNIHLDAASAGELARTIVQAADLYGPNSSLAGTSINPECVSANPTGPAHLGGARWVAVGDSLIRLITVSGAKVTREYYLNDHGSQIDRFAKPLYVRAMGREALEDGYGGQHIANIVEKARHDALQAGEADPIALPEDETVEAFRVRGVELMFGEIKERLRDFCSELDVFFHEDPLHESGAVAHAIDTLRERGEAFDEDGAVWLRTTSYGDDKDRALIKSDGQAAYFVGDVAYYLNRRNRGADSTIYLPGMDHHGYIGRMTAMCQAFGDTPSVNIQILAGQMANLLKNSAPARIFKRAGMIVILDDLIDVVGIDVARYALVHVSMGPNLGIGLDLFVSHTNENSVHHVQYAYARTRNAARNAAEHGANRGAGFDPATLDTPANAELLGALADFPAQIAQVAELREPYRLTRYLEQLAPAYHAWYGQCRVTPRGDDPVEPGYVACL